MDKRSFISQLPSAIAIGCAVLGTGNLAACIWDADTLGQERHAHPKMAAAILSPAAKPPDPAPLRQRIQRLLQSRRDDDPAWWNDLAGAHLRLGQPQEAVKLLEPVLQRFDTNYGVHANLGTAYHLLGHYKDAEREIARDLEINPEAHFGLEKYHLALLQYLSRDTNYQYRHVYVDEFTAAFLQGGIMAFAHPIATPLDVGETNAAQRAELENELRRLPTDGEDAQRKRFAFLGALANLDMPPAYCDRWNLGADPKLEEGMIYMASLNPREPACFVMLGVKSLRNRDLNLAIKAYERAIQLGSSQRDLLQSRIDSLRDHIHKARLENLPRYVAICLIAGAIAFYVILKIRSRLRKQSGDL
jgi:tetratricopeptide (TPR) repeat protein